MNREDIIKNIKSMNDIKEIINSNVKYLNIDIVNVEKDVISYLKEYGQKYLYSDAINNKNGYIYVDYNTFIKGENIISNIISNIPNNLTILEKSKYLYVSIGKILGYDINSIPEKNDSYNLSKISTINNIWGALANLKASNQAYCKVYLYLSSLLNIDCEIIAINNKNYLCNKLNIDNNSLIIDLTNDIPNISAKFRTKHFSNYNNDINLDKKIGYIIDDYNDNKLDKIITNIDYNDNNFIQKFLLNTQNILNISNICPIELSIIYESLFDKYCPDIKIFINNLYINNNHNRDHFILITYNNIHYSYNYNKNTFIEITDKELKDNIKNNKIGIYLNENIPIIWQ